MPDSVPEQIALIERAIAEKPDAAVFVPCHETAVNDAILGFDAANIPLFNIIVPTTAGRRVTFVGSDDRALAKDIARYLFGKMGGRGTIIIVEGTPASATSHLRFAGFQDALAEHQDIAVRCSLQGEYQRNTARDVFLDRKGPVAGRRRRALRQRRHGARRARCAGAGEIRLSSADRRRQRHP